MPVIDTLPDLIFNTSLIKPGGWFILEHSDKYSFTGYSRFREIRKYGSVNFTIFA